MFNAQAERLAEKYRQQHAEARRLSHALALALRSRRQSDWQFDQEEGLIDASRLAQIVAAPHRRRTFKQEYQSQDLDAAITLLVDCSGSMRGKWMDLTVLALQALGDALSLSAVPFEVLGFTTAATNGGQTLAAWRDAGSPPPPEARSGGSTICGTTCSRASASRGASPGCRCRACATPGCSRKTSTTRR